MKKIIFWLDNNLMNFCIAKMIQEENNYEINAIVDVTDKPKQFFLNQKLLNFKNLWFYHDNLKNLNDNPDIEFLKLKEKEYGFNLLTLTYNDRILYNFNEFFEFSTNHVFRLLELEIKFFEQILDKSNPDYVIMDPAFLRPSLLFSLICKKRKIKILMIIPTRLYNKCIISDDWNNLGYDKTLNNKSEIKNSYDNEEIKNNEQKIEKYSYKKQLTQLNNEFLQSKKSMIHAVLNFITSKNSNVKTHYTYFGRTKSKVLQKYFFDMIRTKIRKNFIDKNLSYDTNIDSKFLFLPLHLEQEHSLLVLAPYYTNQLEFIKHVLKSMPIGYKLVIKEHPAMFARSWHSIQFYKEIMKMPNVIFMHPTVDSNKLLKSCSLVVTVGGSVSFEAGYYNKPAIIFIETSWSMLPHIHKVNSIESLTGIIISALEKSYDQKEFLNYIRYIEENSFEHNPFKTAQIVQNYFHYGGFSVDVDITEEKIKKFTTENYDEIKYLTMQYMKKI